jgi:hypothetical protein
MVALFAEYTYLSAIEVCFRNRRFPIEMIMPGRYMKIKSIHSGQSENRRFIAEIISKGVK